MEVSSSSTALERGWYVQEITPEREVRDPWQLAEDRVRGRLHGMGLIQKMLLSRAVPQAQFSVLAGAGAHGARNGTTLHCDS